MTTETEDQIIAKLDTLLDDERAALLDGALQGIRSVAARMATYRRIRKSMDTYDGQGRKHTIPGEVARTVQKRA